MKYLNKIVQGDCLELMRELPDGSVDCVITSPPYWGLRDYGVNGQLGLESTHKEYITKLCNIFDEVKRVLKKPGTCWVNIGDTYASGGGKGVEQSMKRRLATTTGAYPDNSPNSKLRNTMGKCLVGIPERFRLEMTDNRGWTLRNTIIWHKPSCMPSSVSDRFTVDFEYLYFFVKQRKYYFEQQKEPTVSKDNIVRNRDITKLNNTPGRSKMNGLKENKYDFKNKRCVWKIPTRPFPEAHFAVYPPALIETPIKAGCPKGGIVLDPFMGAGTTALVALKLNCQFIGFELNQEYVDMANKRISQELSQGKILFEKENK